MTLASFFKVYSDIDNKQKLMDSEGFVALSEQLKKVQEAIESKKALLAAANTPAVAEPSDVKKSEEYV